MARFVKVPKKVKAAHFPLATQSGRVALLTGVLAGVVGKDELQQAVTQDVQRRQYRKPCVSYGIRYDSVSEAARAAGAVGARAHLFPNMVKNISRWCTQDCWEGFYWCE
jgi:homoserine kinase